MNWYLAKLVFRIICGDGNHTPRFDEQLRLIQAGSSEEAFQKSQSMGMKEEDVFFNQQQQLVKWQFINTSDLYQLNELIDGAALYSRIEEKDNAESYIQFVSAKAEQIRFGDQVDVFNNVLQK
jgi:hypothetical protein